MGLCVFSCILKKGGLWNEVWDCSGRELWDHVHEIELRLKMLARLAAISRAAWDEGLKSMGRRISVGMEGKRLTAGMMALDD
jgi:hypothetical protein